jgi:hypothetical protein
MINLPIISTLLDRIEDKLRACRDILSSRNMEP